MTHEVIFDGAYLRAILHPGDSKQLMVTFDYRQNGKNDFTAIRHSTHFARMRFAQLSIKTKVNDWFINPDTTALETALTQIGPHYPRVHMLGYSMGGYGALRFARALGAASAVLISPQFSILPELVPFDARYRAEGRRFDAVLGDLTQRAHPGLQGLILLDPFARADLQHAHMIQTLFPALNIVRLPFGGHPASLVLRDAGKTWTINRAAVLAQAKSRAITQSHREGRRGSVGYWLRMALYCDKRRPMLAGHAWAQYIALGGTRGPEAECEAGD